MNPYLYTCVSIYLYIIVHLYFSSSEKNTLANCSVLLSSPCPRNYTATNLVRSLWETSLEPLFPNTTGKLTAMVKFWTSQSVLWGPGQSSQVFLVYTIHCKVGAWSWRAIACLEREKKLWPVMAGTLQSKAALAVPPSSLTRFGDVVSSAHVLGSTTRRSKSIRVKWQIPCKRLYLWSFWK